MSNSKTKKSLAAAFKSKVNKWKRRGTAANVTLTVMFFVFLIYAFTLIYPVFWTLMNAMKTNVQYSRDSFGLPPDWLVSNFAEAFRSIVVVNPETYAETNLWGMLFNSIWQAGGSAFLSVAVSCMTGYVISKYRFPGRSFLYSLAVTIMIIPIVGNLPAAYNLMYSLHIVNSPFILIQALSGFGFNFIVLYGFFKNVSWSYAEAAFIDGASDFKVFLKIMVPQALPCVLSLFIVALIGCWNDYMTPLLYMDAFPTLASGLFIFRNRMTSTGANMPVYFAAILISMVPVIILFTFFSETIMNNTTTGGLKDDIRNRSPAYSARQQSRERNASTLRRTGCATR